MFLRMREEQFLLPARTEAQHGKGAAVEQRRIQRLDQRQRRHRRADQDAFLFLHRQRIINQHPRPLPQFPFVHFRFPLPAAYGCPPATG